MSVMLTDTASWGLMLGVVMPLLQALVQRPDWSPARRRVIAVGAAAVGGVLLTLAGGEIGNGATVLQTVAAVLVASQTAYSLLWKATGLPAALAGQASKHPATVQHGDKSGR